METESDDHYVNQVNGSALIEHTVQQPIPQLQHQQQLHPTVSDSSENGQPTDYYVTTLCTPKVEL